MKINRFKAIVLGLSTMVAGAVCASAQTNTEAGNVPILFTLQNGFPIIVLQGLPVITDTGGVDTTLGFSIDFGTPYIAIDGSGKVTGVAEATVSETDPKTSDSISSTIAVNITGALADKGTTPQAQVSFIGKGFADNGVGVQGHAQLNLKFSGLLSVSGTTIITNKTFTTNCVLVTNPVCTIITNITYVGLGTNTNNAAGTVLISNTTPVTVTNVSGGVTNVVNVFSETNIVAGTNGSVVTNTAATNITVTYFSQLTTTTNPCGSFELITNECVAFSTNSITNLVGFATNETWASITNGSGEITNFALVSRTITNFNEVLITNPPPSTNFYFAEITNNATIVVTNETTHLLTTNTVENTNYVVLTSTNAGANTNGLVAVIDDTNAATVVSTTNVCTNSLVIYENTNSCTIVTNITYTTNTGVTAIIGTLSGTFNPGIKGEKSITLPKNLTAEIDAVTANAEVDVNVDALIVSTTRRSGFIDLDGTFSPPDGSYDIAVLGNGSGSEPASGTGKFSMILQGVGPLGKGSMLVIKGVLVGDPITGDPATVFPGPNNATGKVLGQTVKTTSAAASSGGGFVAPGDPLP